MKFLVLFLIRIYQKTISPDHGVFPVLRILGSCRHNPTCSQYAYEAIDRLGVIRGVRLGIKRIITCR